MLQHEVTKEDVFHLCESFISLLDPRSDIDRTLFKESLQLFREGNIYNTKVEDDLLFATVYDRQEVKVTLDLYFVQLSECSVDEDKLCHHKLAAFFYVYSSFAPVRNVIDQFEGRIKKEKKQVQKQYTPRLPTVTIVSFDSVADWLELFEKQYVTFLNNTEKAFSHFNDSLKERLIAERIVTEYYDTLLAQRPKEPKVARLYTVHAGVTAIVKLHEFAAERFFNREFVISKVQELVTDLEHALLALRGVSLTEKQRGLVEESIDRFDVLLRVDEDFHYLSMLLYRIIWSTVLYDNEWLIEHERELANQFNTLMHNKNGYITSTLGHSLHIALIHFAFLLEEDDLAFTRAESLPLGDIPVFYYMIETAYDEKQYDRMLRWLDYAKDRFVPLLKDEGEYRWKRQMTDTIISYYDLYSEAVQSDAAMIKALQQMLPYSFYTYNDYLLATEHFKGWAELQLLVGFQPETHGQQFLRKIEKADRSVLLPLYHQAVQNAISEKNRKAYKLAVRRLKKLRTHYRQLKKFDKWETYIAFLAKKHRRLRAFQEELRKGKLIND